MIRALLSHAGRVAFCSNPPLFLGIKITSKNHSATFHASAFTLQQEQGVVAVLDALDRASGIHQRGAVHVVHEL